MPNPIFPVGSFVWCRFPLRESPRVPGPKDHLHLAYVAATQGDDQILTIYTTSVTWDPSTPVAVGVIVVPEELASLMGQKPFYLDTRRVALLPVTKDWFPSLEGGQPVIVSRANKTFRAEVDRVVTDVLTRHHQLVERYGPGVPDFSQANKWTPPTNR
jgi:hypothetical protein